MSDAGEREDVTPADDEAVPLERCLTRVVNPQRVASVRERLPAPELAGELAATFRVLSEPARVKIVAALLEAGELCVCDLAASVGLSETATSQHLRILRAQRAVRNRREGRIVYYALADAHIRVLMDVALQHVSHGDD
ncbi:MAG: metalloregulator ArsR/SmtB family transcription factor [Solirubrobacteraceae bacterium]|nr:metalloregulator ArsR/SmtB family transcription factor [Solirubrobacteraceae bacterium]